MDHGSILPCLPGCHVPGGCFSRRQSRGSLAAGLPALPAQLGSTLSVHPTKPSGEAGWPSEKLLQEHLSPGSSQGIPHLLSSLFKFPDVVLHMLQGGGKIKFSLHLQPPSCHVLCSLTGQPEPRGGADRDPPRSEAVKPHPQTLRQCCIPWDALQSHPKH